MRAFHGDPKIKEFYLNRLKEHFEMDEIVKGVYWENGKGCAVGCTLHSDNHENYELELGIPQILATLEDRIFENLPDNLAKDWPLTFLESIREGADLSQVWPKFAIFLLTDKTQCNSINENCVKVSNLYKRVLNGEIVEIEEFTNAVNKGNYAANYAANAANYAADYEGNYAAYYAARAAYYAASAASAANYEQIAWIKQSEKLLELLKECE